MTMHALLKRQIQELGIDPDAGPASAAVWSELLKTIAAAYDGHDHQCTLLARSRDQAAQQAAALFATTPAGDDQPDDGGLLARANALRLSEARLASLLSLSADWIWEQDQDLRYSYLSDGIEAAAGIPPAQMIGQRRMSDRSFDVPAAARIAYDADLAARRSFRDFTYGYRRPDGVRRYIRISGEPVFDEEDKFRGYRGVGRDVTVATVAEQRVQELARFDALTGLANRSMFLCELDLTMARARRKQTDFSVCFIDLDRFKSINESLGHGTGDELLKVIAARLRGLLRSSDLVARIGGDEFGVLLEEVIGPANMTRVAQKILAAISEPVTLDGCTFLVTGSMGIAQYPRDGTDAGALMQHADAAMYLAKARGKNNLQFYMADLADESARQFALESELWHALEREELVLHYQPKVDVASGRMGSVEALVRWNHPQRGLVLPGDFIGLAEERGLIVPLGRWVIRAACRQIREWRNAGLNSMPVAINLSARQFSSDSLVEDLVDAMREFSVAPEDIEVELTESALMAEPRRANEVLHRLSAMGVHVAIDDFGTGYSSLSYLKRFPARTVKIDRSFISGLPADSDDAAITQAVIAMAHSLDLLVVAEGVETEDQMAMLRQLGCDQAQGFLLGRPMPADELALRLTQVDEELASAA